MSGFDHGAHHERADGPHRRSPAPAIAPGKQTLVEAMPAPASDGAVVQRKPGGEATADVHTAAAQGISGASQPLPHAGALQRVFGRHDLGSIQAHTDAAATDGARAMGAQAFATGEHVAFAGAPDLHTAAHEVAHVVQQRGGVSLTGGVGAAGDAYERNADAVADRAVQGLPADDLLPAPGAGGGAVQRQVQRQGGGGAPPGAVAISGTMRRIVRATSLFRRQAPGFVEMPGYFFHADEIVRDATPSDGASPSGGYSYIANEAELCGWVPTTALSEPVGTSAPAASPQSSGATFDVAAGTMYRAVSSYDLTTAAGATSPKTGAKLLTAELAQATGTNTMVGNVPWLQVRLPRADGTTGWVPKWALTEYSPGLGTATANGVWQGGYKWSGPDRTAPGTHDATGTSPGLAAYTQMPAGAAVEVLTDPATKQPIDQAGDGTATTSGGGTGTTPGAQAGKPAPGGFWYVRNAAHADVVGWFASKWVQPGVGATASAAATGTTATTSSALSVADEVKTVFPNGFPVCFVVDYQKQSDDPHDPAEQVATFFSEASSYAQRYRGLALTGGQIVLGAPNLIHAAADITAIMDTIHTALRTSTAAQGATDIPLWSKASSVAIFAHGGPQGMSLGDDANQAAGKAAPLWARYHEIWAQLNADARLPATDPNKMTPAQRNALKAEADQKYSEAVATGDFNGDLATGGGVNGVEAFTHNLSPFVTGNVKISLFACSTGDGGGKEQNWATPSADQPNGGNDSFADQFATGLGEGGANNATVLGHTTIGPTVRNADARLFGADNGTTGGTNYFNFCYDDLLPKITFQWVSIDAPYLRQLVFSFYTQTVDNDSALARRMALDPDGFKLDVQARTTTWIEQTLRPMVDIAPGSNLWSVRTYAYNADATGKVQIPTGVPVHAALGSDGFVVRFQGNPWSDSVDHLRSYAHVSITVDGSATVFDMPLTLFQREPAGA